MANFTTHLTVASIASGLLATLSLGISGVSVSHVVIYCIAGTLGGILPDIDSDNSTALKIIFNCLGIGAVVGLLVVYRQPLSIAELWGLCLIAYLMIRYCAACCFEKLTVHRGVFHSLSAGLCFWFLTTSICFGIMEFSSFQSWVVGFFVFFGYMMHLLLDEVYGVDLLNRRVKRSFGSALKIAGRKNIGASLVMVSSTAAAFVFTPPLHQFLDVFLDKTTYTLILSEFWPRRFL